MADLEKVIKGLECCAKGNMCRNHCPYDGPENDIKNCTSQLARDALSLLKAQELPDVKPEKLEERTTKWLDQMTAEERLEEIAAILDDWDGYRTAKGLGGLINEVWAYASYPVKAQEPRVMTLEEVKNSEVVYLEDYSDPDDGVSPIIRPAINVEAKNGGIFMLDSIAWDEGYIFNADDDYGKEWRCWTSRPSDLERKNTPWEN